MTSDGNHNGRPARLIACVLVLVLSAASHRAAAGEHGNGDAMEIDLTNPAATNIAPRDRLLRGTAIAFQTDEAAPPGSEYFFVRYRFAVGEDGDYRLAFLGLGSGTAGASRYSWSIDVRPAVHARATRPAEQEGNTRHGWHEQVPVRLAAGEHVLELQFHPEQRLRAGNRVTDPWKGHAVSIEKIRVERAPGQAARTGELLGSADHRLLLKQGDVVVFLGDSITDEAFYLRPFVRILRAVFPDGGVRCYNSGISLNRTWEAVERLDDDVLALEPDWVVVALGVNDAIHMAPDEFARNYEMIISRLRERGINVLCTTPSGCVYNAADPYHARDRSEGLDATQAMEARAAVDLAAKHKQPCADVLAAFRLSGLDRASLMANQWHPNPEGARLMAMCMLRALGFTRGDAARTGDARDLACFDALAKTPAAEYPAYRSEAMAPAAAAGTLIAATSFTGNTVCIFSAQSGKLVARIPVGHHPVGVAYSPARRKIYAACEGAGRIEVISVPELRREAPLEIGDVYPMGIAISSDGRTAWTADFFGSGISEIDLEAGTVRRRIALGQLTEAVAAVEGERKLLVATHNGVMLVDLAKGEAAVNLGVSKWIGGFIAGPGGRLTAIDAMEWRGFVLDPNGWKAAPAAIPAQARAIVPDPGGDGFYAGDCLNGKLIRVRGGDAKPEAIADVEFPMGIAVIP
ncbi:MAG TPA: GDSL-type esterase/lipase family protein [Planctomycetota bacterium]|nr:GDSL-type esterase/lipase family protein [Planctomycetota bacterium]